MSERWERIRKQRDARRAKAEGGVLMRNDHNVRGCQRCLRYALWVWPFTTMERWRSGKRNAEKEWMESASDGYRIAPFIPGPFAESVTPDRGDLEHVLKTRPDGMSGVDWIEAIGVIGAPTPWDEVPTELGFWHDLHARERQREEWIAENGWSPPTGSWASVEGGGRRHVPGPAADAEGE